MNRLIRRMSTRCILFLISFFIACSVQKEENISLRWKNEKATGIIIPISLVEEHSDLQNRLKVQLIQPRDRSSILGEIKIENDRIVFEPLVPFTRGLRYEVLLDNNLIAEIEVPKSETTAPDVIAIYPSQDTVPENLLKMYFHFSQPMSESHSLSFINMMSEGDTLKGTFLDLQPELWNNDGTLLTLWLDPGRIKRDLIPNQKMGTPLVAGNHYMITISSEWKSKNGVALLKSYSKTFFTTKRDEQSPSVTKWKIAPPPSGTKEILKIDLIEELDYGVLMEAFQIVDAGSNAITGTFQLTNEERTLLFTPTENWRNGNYEIKVEARLEDLSGNNLNRPFDRDITKTKSADQKFFSRSFKIR